MALTAIRMLSVPTNVSVTQRLADTLLEGQLEQFVRSRRAQGRSWRLISRDLYEATQVDVSYETLRTWFPEAKAAS